jgi:hypothetical protein
MKNVYTSGGDVHRLVEDYFCLTSGSILYDINEITFAFKSFFSSSFSVFRPNGSIPGVVQSNIAGTPVVVSFLGLPFPLGVGLKLY